MQVYRMRFETNPAMAATTDPRVLVLETTASTGAQ
jgi:hypothetical protein